MNLDAENKLYPLQEASQKFLGGLSTWTLRKHIVQGTVKPTRIGRRVFLSVGEITRIQQEGLPSLK
jgi:hypothetical protein